MDGERMIEVAAAIIENTRGEILIAKRSEHKSQGGLWEFPGGKVEAGESAEECLRRELREEMKIEIQPYAYFGTYEHDYGTATIRLIAYKSYYVRGEIQLVDHDAYRWVTCAELGHVEFAAADIPFVRRLMEEE